MTITQFRTELAGGDGTPPYFNVMHVMLPDDPTDADAQKVTINLETFYTSLHLLYPTDVAIYPSSRVITVEATPRILSAPGAAIAGGGGQPTAAQLAACLSWQTAYAGPRYRGRTYIGPLATSTLSASTGQISGSAQTSLLNAGTQLISDIAGNGAGFALGVYSAVSGFQAITPITSCVARFRTATQRRRN